MPPVAANVVDEPVHILTPEPALTVGNEFTVTVTLAVFEHPLPFVPVAVYVVVTVGLAVGLAQVVQDKPADGDQL